jgi:hypothetical protein
MITVARNQQDTESAGWRKHAEDLRAYESHQMRAAFGTLDEPLEQR